MRDIAGIAVRMELVIPAIVFKICPGITYSILLTLKQFTD